MSDLSKLNIDSITDEFVEIYLSDDVKNMKMLANKAADKKLKYMLCFLIHLSSFNDYKSNGYCFATDSAISSAIGCSKTYVPLYAKRLKNLGFITKIERGSVKGGQATRYWLNDDLLPDGEEKTDSQVTVEELLKEIEKYKKENKQYKAEISNLQAEIIELNRIIKGLRKTKEELVSRLVG